MCLEDISPAVGVNYLDAFGFTTIAHGTEEDTDMYGNIYTDIALGKRNGVTSVLVLSGETQPADVEAATDADKPDFVFDSLDDVDRMMF